MLTVEELVCGYPESGFLLKKVTFAVQAGEMVGIIGPNASGKSTLLKGISKVLNPVHGRVLFCGKDIRRERYRELAQKMAVVSQEAGEAGAGFTVKEFVLMGRIPYRGRFQLLETRQDWQAAQEAMLSANVLDLAGRDINRLSGGERQRAVIARALCQEPELLILDEPTSHLDIGHQVEILDLLKRLNRNGLTVIMVLHDLNLASLYSSRLILLVNGGIYSAGPPEEIIREEVIGEVYNAPVVVERSKVTLKPIIHLIPR